MPRLAIALCALALLALTPGAAGANPPRAIPFRTFAPAALAAGKQRAESERALPSPLERLQSPSAPEPMAVIPTNLNQPGTAAGTVNTTGTPPDPTGAVGPDHYVEFVNSEVAF